MFFLEFLWLAHRFEQYLTFAQSRFHFRRQVKGRSQTGQTLVGSTRRLMCKSMRAATNPLTQVHCTKSKRSACITLDQA